MKNRPFYLDQLLKFKDEKLIKVITGVRRCGKSTLLDLLSQKLSAQGIAESNVIKINFESMEYDFIVDYRELYRFIKERLPSGQKTYILLDEIQRVAQWERVVNSLLVDEDVDIYITGSNAHLLSSELSTYLAGRYVEIKMLPLSFSEFLDFIDEKDEKQFADRFDQYLKYGSLPIVARKAPDPAAFSTILIGIYNTVIIKDIIQRNTIKDTALLENVLKFILSNVGSIVSPKKISDYINSGGSRTTNETVDNYLKMFEDAFIVYPVKRYDLKGKLHLKTLGKYYVVDTGIRNAILGFREADYGHILENIVYLELLRRGYRVSIGKYADLEIDFVAERPEDKCYIQVTSSMADAAVQQRELRPLLALNDNYPKTILSMDKNFLKSISGVQLTNIIDFLLDNVPLGRLQ